MEVRQHRSADWIGVSEVVVADSVVEGECASRFPGVLSEASRCGHGKFVLPGLRLARNDVVRQTGLGIRLVVDQIDHIVVVQIGNSVGSCKERQVVAVPALIPHFETVAAMNQRQHIAPVITVLDEIALREAVSEANSQLSDTYDRNGKGSGLVGETFDAVITKGSFVEHVGGECVRLIDLNGGAVVVTGGSKGRTDGGTAGVDGIA